MKKKTRIFLGILSIIVVLLVVAYLLIPSKNSTTVSNFILQEDLFTKAGGTPYWTDNGPGYRIDSSDQMVLQIDTWVTVSDGQEALEAQAARFPDRAYTVKKQSFHRESL